MASRVHRAAAAECPLTEHQDGVLSEAANEWIFRDQIVPMFLAGAPAQDHPALVIVAGQTGAGKTAVTAMVKHALRTSGFITINMDFYNPMHPSFHHWQTEDETTASAKVRPDGPNAGGNLVTQERK